MQGLTYRLASAPLLLLTLSSCGLTAEDANPVVLQRPTVSERPSHTWVICDIEKTHFDKVQHGETSDYGPADLWVAHALMPAAALLLPSDVDIAGRQIYEHIADMMNKEVAKLNYRAAYVMIYDSPAGLCFHDYRSQVLVACSGKALPSLPPWDSLKGTSSSLHKTGPTVPEQLELDAYREYQQAELTVRHFVKATIGESWIDEQDGDGPELKKLRKDIPRLAIAKMARELAKRRFAGNAKALAAAVTNCNRWRSGRWRDGRKNGKWTAEEEAVELLRSWHEEEE